MKTKIRFSLLLPIFFAPASVSSESIRSCEIPQITTVVVDKNGLKEPFQDTSRRKFKPNEKIHFLSNGAFTGYYTVAFIDDGIPDQIATFLNDPTATFRFPCKGGRCFDMRISRDAANQKYDDQIILYTPCFSKETRDARQLKAVIEPQFRSRIPKCENLSVPKFSNREIFFSFESQPDHGCVSIRKNGPPTFKVRIDVQFR